MTDYYKRNRDKILAYQKEYRELHKKPPKTEVIKPESSNTDELTKTPKVIKSKLQNKKQRLTRLLMRNQKRVLSFITGSETPKATDKVIEFIYLDIPINPFLSV